MHRRSRIEAIPALVACVAIAAAVLAAERKLAPAGQHAQPSSSAPLLAPAPIRRPFSGDSK